MITWCNEKVQKDGDYRISRISNTVFLGFEPSTLCWLYRSIFLANNSLKFSLTIRLTIHVHQLLGTDIYYQKTETSTGTTKYFYLFTERDFSASSWCTCWVCVVNKVANNFSKRRCIPCMRNVGNLTVVNNCRHPVKMLNDRR